MKHSNLLTALVSGKWLIDPRVALAQRDIVDKLMNREYLGGEFAKMHSDDNPLHIQLESGHSIKAESSQYDKIADGSTAIFPLQGTMLKYGTWCSYGTLELASAMKEAAAHKRIGSIVLDIDSGGGSVDAIPPMIEAIKFAQALGKPVVASVDLCASAALYAAVFCDEIIANNDLSSEIGSIGVMMSFADYTKYYTANGVEQHVILSSLSDWKNLPYRNALLGTPADEDGRDTRYDLLISEELDPLAIKFQNDVKQCREGKLNIDIEGILNGRMFFSTDAVEHGLIDSIGTLSYAAERAKVLRDNNIVNKYINSKN